jgi:hypothetical protein
MQCLDLNRPKRLICAKCATCSRCSPRRPSQSWFRR